MEGQHTGTPEFKNLDTTPRTPMTLQFDSIDDLREKLPKQLSPGAEVDTYFVATEKGHMQTKKGPFSTQSLIELVRMFQKRTGSIVDDITLDVTH